MDNIKAIFMTFHVIVAAFGCFVNIFLIYLARFHSPKKIRTYATLIMNFAFTDFLSCLADIFTLQRTVPIEQSAVIFLSNGPCQFLGHTYCYIGYNFMLHLLLHSLYSLLFSFSFRFYILFRDAPKTRTVLVILLFVYFPSFCHLMISSSIQGPTDQVLDILYEHDPGFKARYVMVSGVSDMTTLGAAFFVWDVSLPIIPIYITILIIRSRIIRSLSFYSANMSSETKNLHKQLLTALTYQACIPIFFLIGVVSFTLEQMKIVRHPALGYTTVTGLMLISVLTPMASLIFVRPYGEKIKKSLGFSADKPSVIVVSTTNNTMTLT